VKAGNGRKWRHQWRASTYLRIERKRHQHQWRKINQYRRKCENSMAEGEKSAQNIRRRGIIGVSINEKNGGGIIWQRK
jgi:hypothetical protein